MIAFKDLFTIQYACHDGIDFKKKIAISLKYLEMCFGKRNRQNFQTSEPSQNHNIQNKTNQRSEHIHRQIYYNVIINKNFWQTGKNFTYRILQKNCMIECLLHS